MGSRTRQFLGIFNENYTFCHFSCQNLDDLPLLRRFGTRQFKIPAQPLQGVFWLLKIKSNTQVITKSSCNFCYWADQFYMEDPVLSELNFGAENFVSCCFLNWFELHFMHQTQVN